MYQIREANQNEYDELGELMVHSYANLDGFPSPSEIPEYYSMLKNVGEFAKKPKAKLFVAVSNTGKVDGGLVYFGDIKYYGSGDESTLIQKAAAFRLLAVNQEIRRQGLGKKLVQACFEQAKSDGFDHLLIHSTKFMMVAWKMYERIGFERFPEIDFERNGVKVYGFKYLFK